VSRAPAERTSYIQYSRHWLPVSMLPKFRILRHSLCLALLCPGALAAAAEARVEIIFVSRKRSKERVQRDKIAAVI